MQELPVLSITILLERIRLILQLLAHLLNFSFEISCDRLPQLLLSRIYTTPQLLNLLVFLSQFLLDHGRLGVDLFDLFVDVLVLLVELLFEFLSLVLQLGD